MHKQLPIWQLIQQSLQLNIAVMLLYVLESKGSSPGRQGFMMAVNAKADMSGSLGGGIMEHKFVEMAKAKLQLHEDAASVHLQVHDKTVAKNQSGMICSGEQTIFLYPVKKEEQTVIGCIISVLQQSINASLILSPGGINFSNDIPAENYQFLIKGEDDFVFTEKIGYKNKLIIIGGGHCALALSHLMSSMDFYITLFDHREALHTMEQNHFVQEKKVLHDFAELNTLISSSANTFVVVMTVGYRTDSDTLKALAGKNFAYLGVLGSKSKIDKMFAQLAAEGIDEAWLNTIHAPIGLPIKSQSPVEIAVSIAGEMISVKNASK
jgi:xanthine dehydrogenase accessory factor